MKALSLYLIYMTMEFSIERNAEQEKSFSFGLIMLKPNTLSSYLDTSIIEMLNGNCSEIFYNQSFIDKLEKVNLIGTFYRNLEYLPYGENLLNVFYGNLRTKRYFPLIMDLYKNNVVFLLIEYSGDNTSIQEFLKELKGNAAVFDASGKILKPASGLRGLFSTPYRFYSAEERNSLEDEKYIEARKNILENFLHTCDSPIEVARALKLLLNEYELDDLETRVRGIKYFISENI